MSNSHKIVLGALLAICAVLAIAWYAFVPTSTQPLVTFQFMRHVTNQMAVSRPLPASILLCITNHGPETINYLSYSGMPFVRVQVLRQGVWTDIARGGVVDARTPREELRPGYMTSTCAFVPTNAVFRIGFSYRSGPAPARARLYQWVLATLGLQPNVALGTPQRETWTTWSDVLSEQWSPQVAEPDGPPNGSQPIRSDSNQTSAAAGPRR